MLAKACNSLSLPLSLSKLIAGSATVHSATSHGHSRLASAMGRRRYSRRDARLCTTHRQASQAAPEPGKKATAKDYSLLDLSEVMVEELYFKLPCAAALALGSTCRALQQLLQPLRSAKIEQYLESGALAPDVQTRRGWHPAAYGGFEGGVRLYLSWTVQASRILYHLVMKEKIPPDVLWAAVVPRLSTIRPKEYSSVCCSFGCLDWVSGSMHFNGSQTLLYQRLAYSDLVRLDTTFSGMRDKFVSEGLLENRLFIHLRKNEPDFTKQDATLVVYWASGVVQAEHVDMFRYRHTF